MIVVSEGASAHSFLLFFVFYFGLLFFCCEPVFLVRAAAERHQGAPAASAPGLNNLPINDNEVRPVLGRSNHNIRHTHTITSLHIIVLEPWPHESRPQAVLQERYDSR